MTRTLLHAQHAFARSATTWTVWQALSHQHASLLTLSKYRLIPSSCPLLKKHF